MLSLIVLLAWFTSFEQAQNLAQEQQKPILLVFSGSDWCRPCIQLDREVFQDPAFQAFAEGELILLKADFPRRKKNQLTPVQKAENESLAQRYNPKGEFPLVLLLDPEGNVLSRTAYRPGGAKAFVEYLQTNWPESR
ncbi:MAG: thioredoxin family protein [Bacteroidota bacterium]